MDPDAKAFEEERLRVLRRQVWMATIAPIAAALIAVGGVWLTIRGQLEAQSRAATLESETRSAQALAETGIVACELGPVLYESAGFSDLFDNTFQEFCPEQPPSVAVQRQLIQQLSEHPGQRAQILAMWRAVYEADDWIDEIEDAVKDSGRQGG